MIDDTQGAHQPGDGFVRPLPPEATSPADPFGTVGQPSGMTPWEPEPPRDRTKLWIGGAVLGVVVVAAIAGAIWFRNLIGDPIGSVRSVPPAAQVVITVDGLQLLDFDAYQRLVDAFADPAGDPGVIEEGANLLDELDDAFLDEFGVGFRDGVLPWVGRTASVGLWDIDPARPEPTFLMAIEVRDAAMAGEFLDKAAAAVADELGTVVEAQIVAGNSTVFVAGGEFDSDFYAVVLDDVMLIGGTAAALEQGMAARAGESIADSEAYTDTVAKLPADRVVTAYLSRSLFDDIGRLYDESLTELDIAFPGGLGDDLAGMAASFTLAESGLQFDAVQVFADGSEVPDTMAAPDLVQRLPGETLAYLAIPFSAPDIAEAVASLEAIFGAEYEAMVGELESEFGIDLVGELLPTLDRGFVLAGYATFDGFLAQNVAPFGLIGAIGLNDTGPMGEALEILDDLMEQQSDGQFERIGDVRAMREGIDSIVTWGLGADAMAASSSITELESMLDGVQGGVATGALYQELDAALPGEGLLMYVDVTSIVDLIGMDPTTRRSFAPLRGMGASADVSGNTSAARLLVLIDY